jgi:glycosyltransferase involved in cell wall biosynthesis
MRVLFLDTGPRWSGTTRAFADAAEGMAGRGWDVGFACTSDSVVETRARQRGLDVIPIASSRTTFDALQRLKEVLTERFTEVVVVGNDRDHLFASVALRLADRGAVLRRVPSAAKRERNLRTRIASRAAATGYLFDSNADVDAASRSGKGIAAAVAPLGVDPLRYDTIRGTPRPTLGATANDRLVVCVYDRAGRNRSANVLRTFAMLLPRHPELRLAMIGPGSDDEDLRMHAAALGLTRTVTYLGERDDQLAVLRSADLGWLVASQDDAAWGFLDFMALRIPVVAERGEQAQRYLADGIAGILLPPGDIPANAATLATFLAHDEQRVAMGNAGRIRVTRAFPATAMIDGFEQAALVARERSAWQR